MPIVPFIVYSTAGAFLWSALLVYAGHGPRRQLAGRSATPSSRSTCAIAVGVVLLIVGLVWWRLGMPGKPADARPTRAKEPTRVPGG